MVKKLNRSAKIASTGIYVPPAYITPEEYEKTFGVKVDPAFIDRTNVKVKRVAPPEETPATMAAKAAQMALDNAGLEIKDIDYIIVGTDTFEAIAPPTSPKVQYLLGGHKYEIPSLDIGASCASGVYLLDIAQSLIRANEKYNNILVIGVYAMTRFLRNKFMWEWLFSDGAAAAIVSASDEPGYLASKMRADGSFWDYWGIYFGPTKNVGELIRENPDIVYLDLRKVYPPVNETYWPKLIEVVMREGNFSKEEITQVLFTQVRLHTIKTVMGELGLPLEKTHWVMDKYGYTGNTSVLMALHDALMSRKIEPGKVVVLVQSGVGYQQGAIAFRWI